MRPPHGRELVEQTVADVDDFGQRLLVSDAVHSVPADDVADHRPAQKRRIPGRTQLDFWLDLVLLVAFALDYSFQFTGLSIHEWIGLGFGVALLLHITLHWAWVLRTTRRVFGRLAGRERIRWFVDLALLLVMTLCVVSGILISRSALPALGITPLAGAFWTGLHTTSADITVALVGLHVALSWRWGLTVGRRILRRRAVTSRLNCSVTSSRCRSPLAWWSRSGSSGRRAGRPASWLTTKVAVCRAAPNPVRRRSPFKTSIDAKPAVSACRTSLICCRRSSSWR
jgi:hypothetical protein